MDMNIIGAALSALGLLLAVWSLWYARLQARKVSDLQRNEIISLWAFLDRIRTLIWEVEHIANDDGYVNTGELTTEQRKVIPRVFKGLCCEYVRVVELIVKKTPSMTLDDVKKWRKMGRLKTDWQERQFLNLVLASGMLNRSIEVRKVREERDGG
jgi:hypothetical protein